MIAKQRDDDDRSNLTAEDAGLLHRQTDLHEEDIGHHYNQIRNNAYLLGRFYERHRSDY